MWASLVDGMRFIIDTLYSLTGTLGFPSYALAIIILTIIIKVVLYPLTKKQMRSMKVMQKLAPEVKKVQEKYKDKDPQKMQKKVMEIYKQHNVSPLSGCLPILVQMPILIALYRALLGYEFIEKSHAFLFGIYLAEKDPTYILAILAAVSTYIQSKLTSNVDDPTQRTMMYMMPLLFAWIAATVPAGLALYWVAFNTVGAIQQYFINRQVTATEKGLAEQ